MHTHQEQVLLGARIPVKLREKLAEYCLSHGIKMSYLVSEAIKEKLREANEENLDISLAEERLKTAKFTSQKEFNRYLTKRGIKA